MSKHRREKVAQEILKALANALLVDARDPRLATVSLTSARVSADLQIVNVRWLAPPESEREEMAKALIKAIPYLRSILGERLALRRTPNIAFHYDEGFELGVKMTALLDELREKGEMGDAPPEPATLGDVSDLYDDFDDFDD